MAVVPLTFQPRDGADLNALQARIARLSGQLQQQGDTQTALMRAGGQDMLTGHGFQRFAAGQVRLNADGMRIVPGTGGTALEWFAALPYDKATVSDTIEIEGGNSRISDYVTFSDSGGDARRQIALLAKQVVGITIGQAGLDLFADDNDGGGYAKLYAITDTLLSPAQKGYLRLGQSADHPEFSVDDSTYQNILLASDQLTAVTRLTVVSSQLEIVNNGASQLDLLNTYTLPGGTLGTDRMIRYTATGDYLNNSGASRTITLEVRYGSITMYNDATLVLPVSATRRAWRLEVLMAAQGSATVQVLGGFFAISDTGGATTGLGDLGATATLMVPISGSASGSNDSGSDHAFVVAVQHSAGNASLSFRQQYGVLELIAPSSAASTSTAFVTIGNDASLTNERALTQGNGITITDGGAGSTVTVAFAGGAAPGGELGGTWASPTVDATHSGSAHVLLTANTPAAVGTAGAVGTGTASAKDDHVHAHEAAHINHDTTWAAKGDLIAATANDAASVLTVGANDTFLVADSAQATGLKWADAATARTALGVPATPHGAADHTDVTRSFWLHPEWATMDGGTLVTIGTPRDAVRCVALADAAAQGAFWSFIVPADWASGTLNYQLVWVPGSSDASAHSAQWSVTMKERTAGQDVTAAGSDSNPTGTAAARTANQLVFESVTTGNITPSATGTLIQCEVRRLGANAADTYVGVVNLVGLIIFYTANQ